MSAGRSARPQGRDDPARGAAAPAYERVVEFLLLGAGLLSIVVTLGIIAVLAGQTLAFFREVSLTEFFGSTQWTPLFADKHFGVWPLVSGTVLTAAIAIAVALPFGLLAAIYLSQFAAERTRRILKPLLEVLAGVPTIVYGYFALAVVTPILQALIPGVAGFNALSPGIVMGVMIIPMVSSLSEDALYAVPTHLREGSYALGASRLQAIFRVIVPAATSGIMASVMLAISRAIGETMIVTVAAGQRPQLTLDPRVPIETMSSYIVSVSKGDTPTGTLEYQTIFAVGSTLFLLTFTMNVLSYKFAQKLRKRTGAAS